MKKLILALLVVVTSLAAFAQGKIMFANDSMHLYYMGYTLPADATLWGQPVPLNGVLPSGATLLVDLYGGTSPGSLALITTTTFSSTIPGRQNIVNLNSGLPGGSPAFFQVQIRDSAFPTAALASVGFGYFGSSEIFTVVPSTTIAYNSIVNHGGTALSTWADGTYNLGGAGFGAIQVGGLIPEPSALSLTGLGIAALLTLRRRK